MACKYCGSDSTKEILTPDTQNYAKEECSNCGRWLKWVPFPETKHRPSNHQKLVKKYSQGYCQMCFRVEPFPGRTVMAAHHVVEYCDGGEDTPENIWVVCSMCHAHIHHVRDYMAHYRINT